jgi:oxygen-independent coproporphyrinogen-3 oxidase
MAGLYIHIPFCKKACHYCNFYFSTSMKNKNEIVEALVSEMNLQKNYLSNNYLNSIYFGGGTPSLLSVEELKLLFNEINKNFEIDAQAEITLEANPEDISEEKLAFFSSLGINRLSIGIQSFFDEDLKYMNRSHDAETSKRCLEILKKMNWKNFSLDLIFGLPLLSNEKWLKNMEWAIESGAKHISTYALTVEPQTALAHLIETKKALPIDAEKAAEQYELLMKKMKEHDFIHYEISSFAKKDALAVHNSNYWNEKPYLGIGPSAHSYNGKSRQWNVTNNALYIKSIDKNTVPFTIEELSETQMWNEFIMIKLRLKNGIDKKIFALKVSDKHFDLFEKKCEEYISNGFLISSDTHFYLSEKGKLFADKIASDLFFD